MFSMITMIHEFKAAKKFFEETHKDVKKQYPNVSEKIELSLMIEAPATVIVADKFAKYVDLLLICTKTI